MSQPENNPIPTPARDGLRSRFSIDRMLAIHQSLQQGRFVNATQLTTELGCSRKTIVRDIAHMRDSMDLPIEFDRQLNAVPTVQGTEGELLAMLVAQRALEQYRGTPFHGQLEAAFAKLTGSLKQRISFSPAEELAAVSFRNVGLGRLDLEVFQSLSQAVLRQREVNFEYRKPGQKQWQRRRVQPYHLSNRDNFWYLVGNDLDRHEMRTFALSHLRMRDVRVMNRRFVRPDDFSPQAFFANALGVLGGTGDFQVRIRFDEAVADRVREREWHESQVTVDLPDGGVELRLRLGALAEIERWVLGWGDHAEVLEPRELRERLRAAVVSLVKTYGDV